MGMDNCDTIDNMRMIEKCYASEKPQKQKQEEILWDINA
jgi:hypothetical protein